MNAEIISVGTELLLGEIVNTDAQYLADQLKLCGISAYYQSTVGDNPTRLKQALKQALERSDLIIFTGGLGPTEDDITLSAICHALGIEQQMHQPSADRIKAYFESTGRQMPENNLKQAMLPAGAVVFENDIGTAPGCAITAGGQWIVVLPGVPKELEAMFENKVKPFLEQMSDDVMVTKTVRIIGIGESKAAEMLGAEIFKKSNPSLGIYCAQGEVKLRVCAKSDNSVAAEALCRPVVNKITSIFGNDVYSTNDKNIEQVVVDLLRENGLSVATAESCTAGLVSKRLTDVAGSSQVFSMGVAAYSAETKQQLLGVPQSLIERKGTVCKEVAVYMALGVKNKSESTYGVGITGVAGGSVEGKSNGLVYVAVTDGLQYWVKELHIGHGTDDERDYVRQVASTYALDMVRRVVLGCAENGKPLKMKSKQTTPASASVPAPVKADPETEMQTAVIQELNEDLGPAEPPVIAVEDEQPSETHIVQQETQTAESDVVFEEEPSEQPQEQPTKKKRSFFAAVFPVKGDKAGEVIRKIIVIAAVITMLVSAGYISDHYIKKFNNDHLLEQLRNNYQPEESGLSSNGIQIKFLKLYEKNSDIKGWITIPGTDIDTPVYQTTDNDYYVDHNADKEPSVYGALFADMNATIGQKGNSKNICIYGHHMKDGSMLADLHKYKDIAFYQSSPVIEFDSLYADGKYKVFAAFITNADTKDDNNYFFDYTASHFSNSANFLSWIDQIKARSLYNTAVDVVESDEILTLSTCTYEIRDVELRFVVCARRLRDGESESVNTDAAERNPTPRYPQIWYDRRGGSKPQTVSDWYGTLMSEHIESTNDAQASRIEASMRAESQRLESERLESERIVSQLIASIEAESERNASIAAMMPSSSEPPVSSQNQGIFYIDENGSIVIDESYFNTLSAYSIVSYTNSDNTTTQDTASVG